MMKEDNRTCIWKKGKAIAKEMEEYNERYRKKICRPYCGTIMKFERKARVYGNGKCYCSRMISARSRKFSKRLYSFFEELMENDK